MPDELNEYFRCEEQAGTWVFQVGIVNWDCQTPFIKWQTFRRWKTRPNEARLVKARAAAEANPRMFRRCLLCDEICNAGHMHSDDTCQGCAERHLGVVH